MSGCCGCIFRRRRRRDAHGGSRDSIVPIDRDHSFNILSNSGHENRGVQLDEGEVGVMRTQLNSNGRHGVNPLDLTTDFRVCYIGMLKETQGLPPSQEDHIDLIHVLDAAQGEGKFKSATDDTDPVRLTLSKYGIKVSDGHPHVDKLVRNRFRLVDVIRVVHYEDDIGRQLLAVKVNKEADNVYDCIVFECDSQAQAKAICSTLSVIFDAVCHMKLSNMDNSHLKFQMM
ncbi:integrin beta-1-binding protein 1-like [Anneissia japonica]|uniref:integrin beta-1-binding protein 1-like n=1 Tax=Anneissia japonica TaxID=1529436 RepID=UPI001425B500|nr:integrin beta-1-binding protein 1-like [Anneissia japonica]XP_033100742.1 integrin beta-1-binding protein 1-like [Anneissia japonica]XP_033100743.1 integrin beta-1-binding protein 1-like [Anneissia japonica]